jgi:putative aldouronate transport system permease protein
LAVGSLTDDQWALIHGFTFIPQKLSLEAYAYLAGQKGIIGRAYLMTIFTTLAGGALSVAVTASFAYAVSKDKLPGMKLLRFLSLFTLIFNGGVVATYYSYVRYYHMGDTFFGLIFPYLFMGAYNVILFYNYFKNSVPQSLLDATLIDGAGEFRTYLNIVLPLSTPIIATIALITGVAYWNDWTNGLYYLTKRGGRHLITIQLLLNEINMNVAFLANNTSGTVSGDMKIPSTTVRMAIAVVGMLPVLAAYPYLQKYFVKGISLGAVKE